MTFEQLEKLAMQLDASERERLGVRMLTSLQASPMSEPEQSWIDEAERRLDDILEGRVEGIAGDQFMSLVKWDLGWNAVA